MAKTTDAVESQTANRRLTAFIALFGISGLIVRLLANESRGLWFDEIYTLFVVKTPWPQFLPVAQSDLHPSLYYLLLRLVSNEDDFSDLVWLRTLNSLSWVLVVAIFYLVLLKVDWKSGKFLAVLLAFFSFAPSAVFFSSELRMYGFSYSIVMMLIAISMIFLEPGENVKRPIVLSAAFGLLLGLLVNLHYVNAIVAFSFWAVIAVLTLRGSVFSKKEFFVMTATAAFFILPAAVSLIDDLGRSAPYSFSDSYIARFVLSTVGPGGAILLILTIFTFRTELFRSSQFKMLVVVPATLIILFVFIQFVYPGSLLNPGIVQVLSPIFVSPFLWMASSLRLRTSGLGPLVLVALLTANIPQSLELVKRPESLTLNRVVLEDEYTRTFEFLEERERKANLIVLDWRKAKGYHDDRFSTYKTEGEYFFVAMDNRDKAIEDVVQIVQESPEACSRIFHRIGLVQSLKSSGQDLELVKESNNIVGACRND